MAKIYPDIENIKRLKVPPTDGEWFIIDYLTKKFDDDVEIYYQPFLNGDRPDFILLQKNVGVVIIEVKDWDLDRYIIDENNKWYLKRNNQIIKTPFEQVFQYKDNLFNLHINGMLKAKIENKKFYGKVQVFVYFHNSDKYHINDLYQKPLSFYKNKINDLNLSQKEYKISYETYEKYLEYNNKKLDKLKRDKEYITVLQNNLNRIRFSKKDENKLFTENIYNEFQRVLNPPIHILEQGIEIIYTPSQKKFIESQDVHEKIKGVAGSGKTTVLAKRATNAHKRHGGEVLILTFNITLTSLIHDKISDVRENFSWKSFYITNYHSFIKAMMNNCGIEHNLDNYNNLDIFEEYKNYLPKYKTILIDEIQDYKSEWIKIIRKYFLEDNSEMVLFGDEKQDIYARENDNSSSAIVQGFGKWKKISQSIRYLKNGGRISNLAKKFQEAFFSGKYEIDNTLESFAPSLNLGIYEIVKYDILNEPTYMKIVDFIISRIKENKIHSNDITVLCSSINVLREVDFLFRKEFNEKTMTTFETKEMYEKNIKEIENIRKQKKIAFNLNNGNLKLSTIHSFKGFESENIFLIIHPEDNDEMVYAGITRSKFNLMIFISEYSKYEDFFAMELQHKNEVNYITKNLEILQDAIKNKNLIEINYKQHNKEVVFSDIKPYKILFMSDNYYLACEVQNNYKFSMYRISNILSIEKKNTTFVYDMNILSFVENIQTPFAKYSDEFKENFINILVRVDKSKTYFFENKKFLASQEILNKDEEGNLFISFKVTQEIEIEDLIKKWLPYLKVIEPISLDAKIKLDIKKYLG
jgi:thymidine kinase